MVDFMLFKYFYESALLPGSETGMVPSFTELWASIEDKVEQLVNC